MGYYFTNYLTDEQLEAEESKGLCPVCKKNQIKGKQTKYCSAECRMIFNREQAKEYHKKNPLYHKLPDQRDRTCVRCSKDYVWIKGTGMKIHYCSPECEKEVLYERSKNPLSVHVDNHKAKLKKKNLERQGGKHMFFGDPAWLGGAVLRNLPNRVSYLIACIPDQPYVEESDEEINKIIIEELGKPKWKDGAVSRPRLRKDQRKARKQRAYLGLNWQRGATGRYRQRDKKLLEWEDEDKEKK